MKILSPFLDLLFPKVSLRGREGLFITEAEVRQLTSHPQIFGHAELGRRTMRSLDVVRIASTYSDCPLLRKAIWMLKYTRVPALAEQLAALLCPLIPESYLPSGVGFESQQQSFARCGTQPNPNLPRGTVVNPNPTLLCPVPLFCLRKFSRGFNQAELLACAVSAKTGIPVRSLLQRIRWTGRQTGRKREERLRALSGAFRTCGEVPTGVRILLVDDLTTTGATLQECARTLRLAGAQHVEGLVLAHG